MAKDNRTARLRRGMTLLAEWRLDASEDVAGLQDALGGDADGDLAIAARLGEIASDDSARALAALERDAADKLVRKEAKRSRYRLEQRGVAITREAPAPRTAVDIEPEIEGFVSSVDRDGGQIVLLARSGTERTVILAVLHEEKGLQEIDFSDASRKKLRGLRADLEHNTGVRLVPADWRYCDFLIDRGFRAAQAQGRSPGDYPGMRARITRAPVQPQEPPIRKLLDVEAVARDSDALARAKDLFQEREFLSWLLDPELGRTYVDEALAMADSPIVLTAAQKLERRNSLAQRAAEEVFGGARRAIWIHRLESAAYAYHASERPRDAEAVLATALALERSETGGRGIPLLETLFSVYLDIHVQSVLESRLRRPQQAAADASDDPDVDADDEVIVLDDTGDR